MNEIKKFTKQFTKDIELNGKSIEIRVTINAYYDEVFDLSDFEPEDQKDLSDKIDSYKITPVVIQVECHIDGHCFGLNSLGSCLVSNQSDVDAYINDNKMIEEALRDCKKNLASFLKIVA